MELSAAALGRWEPTRKCFTVESGEIEVMVGGSSAHIELTRTVTIARAV